MYEGERNFLRPKHPQPQAGDLCDQPFDRRSSDAGDYFLLTVIGPSRPDVLHACLDKTQHLPPGAAQPLYPRQSRQKLGVRLDRAPKNLPLGPSDSVYNFGAAA